MDCDGCCCGCCGCCRCCVTCSQSVGAKSLTDRWLCLQSAFFGAFESESGIKFKSPRDRASDARNRTTNELGSTASCSRFGRKLCKAATAAATRIGTVLELGTAERIALVQKLIRREQVANYCYCATTPRTKVQCAIKQTNRNNRQQTADKSRVQVKSKSKSKSD